MRHDFFGNKNSFSVSCEPRGFSGLSRGKTDISSAGRLLSIGKILMLQAIINNKKSNQRDFVSCFPLSSRLFYRNNLSIYQFSESESPLSLSSSLSLALFLFSLKCEYAISLDDSNMPRGFLLFRMGSKQVCRKASPSFGERKVHCHSRGHNL